MSSPDTAVAAWKYRDISSPKPAIVEPTAVSQPAQELLTAEQANARLQAALAEAKRIWEAYSHERDQQQEAQLGKALVAFDIERASYFKRVETEVVQLSLAITRKILHREASLDPTLLSGLVRIAIDRLGAETAVRVRVTAEAVSMWERSVAVATTPTAYQVVADSHLTSGECVVETSMGTASFGFEAQLKEIENSFHDLLAHRPELK